MVRTSRQNHGRGRGRSRYRQIRPRRIPSLLSQSHPHRRHRHRTADSDSGSRPSREGFLSLSVLKELHRPLVLLRGASSLERTEVPPPAIFRFDLSRVEAILARFQLTNHVYLLSITGRAAPDASDFFLQRCRLLLGRRKLLDDRVVLRQPLHLLSHRERRRRFTRRDLAMPVWTVETDGVTLAEQLCAGSQGGSQRAVLNARDGQSRAEFVGAVLREPGWCSLTCLASDKTGTLTRAEMTIVRVMTASARTTKTSNQAGASARL